MAVRPWEPFTIKEILPEPARIFTWDIFGHAAYQSGTEPGKTIGQVAPFIVADVAQFIVAGTLRRKVRGGGAGIPLCGLPLAVVSHEEIHPGADFNWVILAQMPNLYTVIRM